MRWFLSLSQTLPDQLGNLIFRHGEHFYHYEGLRDFKQKFNPVWTPKYLVCPNGLALPRIFADLIALIAEPAQKSSPEKQVDLNLKKLDSIIE